MDRGREGGRLSCTRAPKADQHPAPVEAPSTEEEPARVLGRPVVTAATGACTAERREEEETRQSQALSSSSSAPALLVRLAAQ